MPPVASSTHNALAQSRSPVHGVPGAPVPRVPATHATVVPVLSQRNPVGQS